MLNWLLSNGIFISKELNLEFFVELLNTHDSKGGNQLVSEGLTALTTGWTHERHLTGSGESAVLQGRLNSTCERSDNLPLKVIWFFIYKGVRTAAGFGHLFDQILGAARTHTKRVHSCLVGCCLAQLNNFFGLLNCAIGEQKDLFISWRSNNSCSLLLYNLFLGYLRFIHHFSIFISDWAHNTAFFRLGLRYCIQTTSFQEFVNGVFQRVENLSAMHVCTHLVDKWASRLYILVIVQQALLVWRGQRVPVTKRYDLEETPGRKTLDEQFECLLSHLHLPAAHGPTTIDQEYKHWLLLDLSRYLNNIDVLRFFILNNFHFFLGLGRGKSGYEGHHNWD